MNARRFSEPQIMKTGTDPILLKIIHLGENLKG
jgi:hypothetical protein